MKYLYVVFFLVCGNSIFAHEPNEAFFTFNLGKNQIMVEAVFPWSMRNALINYNPNLETSNNKQDFESTFVAYIRDNLILKDKNGLVLEFKKFKEIDNNGHSHQNNYLLTFKGNTLEEVTNTIMFNTYTNQVNYNTITWNGTKFKTSKNKTSFKINEGNKLDFFHFWWLLLFPILIITSIVFFKKSSR
ncbi:MAG: hypothetical protein HKP48_09935 [Winogradskyella sp.]|uniref:hypothetical protein n=1 Tax=Winogradskyella sp. TaxID=1883156 RepID=UPI001827C18E|nr:hypothetical protein [Winogradskyella sp.]MBT8245338.1 hypothetical protein [Winogradskyella sp.]NNK23587.1 hypothetical protein [Winogradskyella sp.]